MKRPNLIDKEFDALTKDDIHVMRRSYPKVEIKQLLDHYEVSASEYRAKITDLGFVLTRDERTAIQQENKQNEPKHKPPLLTRKEMMAVRMFRGYDRKEFSKIAGIRWSYIEKIERGKTKNERNIQQKYLDVLQIKESELKRIRMVLSGEVEEIEVDREIPEIVKTEVYKKCGGKCAKCGDNRKLHYHHIKKFSDGGLHKVNNIVLLCPACHAKEHIGENAYNLLKSIADKLKREDDIA